MDSLDQSVYCNLVRASIINKVLAALIMSESTSGPSRRRRAPPNPYSQAEHYESLANFLAARNLPVPNILKRPAQERDRSSRSH
jgi:hypothetical protein